MCDLELFSKIWSHLLIVGGLVNVQDLDCHGMTFLDNLQLPNSNKMLWVFCNTDTWIGKIFWGKASSDPPKILPT